MIRRALWVVLSGLAAFSVAAPLAAQVDVIRGRVTAVSVDSAPIENVTVTATSISGGVNRTARTDKSGRYTITFPGGDGDYFVTFMAIGYAPRQFEVKRTADQDILVADARLVRTGSLDTVKTVGAGQRAKPVRNDNRADIGGTEKPLNTGIVPIEQMGDMGAMAASLPGVLFIAGTNGDPSGFSVLGLGNDQNSNTLNGMESGSLSLPRDANISGSLVTAPYDVSRGGFSGGQFNIRPASGSNYITRSSSLIFNSPQLEWTDPAARALGQQYTNASLGGSVAGPFSLDKAFYNVSYQLGRHANELQTLLNTDSLGLETAGIAIDSVARLRAILQGEGVPVTVPSFPSQRLTDNGIVFGSFNFTPPTSTTGQALNLTVLGAWTKFNPLISPTTELPAHSGSLTSWNGLAQLQHSAYFGFGVLSESGLLVSQARVASTPYLDLPGGSVLVNSTFPDGTDGVQSISIGGSSSLNASHTNGRVDLTNQLSWFSEDNKHRIKFTSELRRDAFSTDQFPNQFGTFAFNSLADLQAGTPTSFTRQLTPNQLSSGDLYGALSLGDSYRVNPDVQVQYGVRADGNHFQNAPMVNPEVEQLFGTSNANESNRIYLSPRIGFAWTLGTAPQIGAFQGAALAPRAVVRGGIGLFQNAPLPSLMSPVLSNTGLASGVQQITCVGSAAPTPDWAAYANNPASIPTQCADGSTGSVFANSAPNVTLLAPDYMMQRSLRSNLQWQGAVLDNRLMATLGGTYSRNMHQASFVDLNFNPVEQFTLPDEGGRPVYVQPSSIVPSTGAIAAGDGRISPLFDHVTEMRSDLTSQTEQVSLGVAPLSPNSQYSWSLAYVYNTVRDQQRGFSSTTGNPLDVTWGRASNDWRHQIQYNLGVNLLDVVRVSWAGRFTSGMPFTPSIAGDVNGDGYATNDRAFIFDPAHTADTALASSMKALLAGSSSSVRSCLEKQLGMLASRNSCEGPWTSSANLNIAFNPVKVKLPQRATLQFQVANPLGAADLLLHGENHTRGWGQTLAPDPQLLYVRGFDPVNLRYIYQVNQRFGNTSPGVSAIRNPVVLTAWIKVDLGPTIERQRLTQTLDRGRTSDGPKIPEAMLKAVYSSAGITNPMDAILRQTDSLHLTAKQADSIATLNRWYTVRMDSLWSPVAKYFAALPDHYDQDEAYTRYRRAREASVDLLIQIAPGIKELLTAEQRRKLPDLIIAYLDLRYLAAVRSGTEGAPGGVFSPANTSGPGSGPGARGGGP